MHSLRRLLARAGCRPAEERGSMLVETAFLLVLVMVPLLYLVGTLGRLQAGAYAAAAAAREAGRTFVASPDDDSGYQAARTAATLVAQAHGFSAEEAGVVLTCAADPCLTPGSTIGTEASIRVELPLIPDFLSGAVPTSITMTSGHVAPVDEFREP